MFHDHIDDADDDMEDCDHDRSNNGGEDDGKKDGGNAKVLADMITDRARNVNLLAEHIFGKNTIDERHTPNNA